MGEPQQLFLNGQVPMTSRMMEQRNEPNVAPGNWQKGKKGTKKPKAKKSRREMSADQLERRREATRLRIRRMRSQRTPEQAARDREATMLRMRRLRSKQKEEAARQRELSTRLKPMDRYRCKLVAEGEANVHRLAYDDQCVKNELQPEGCFEGAEYREDDNGQVFVNGYHHHVHPHHSEHIAFSNCQPRGRTKRGGPPLKMPAFTKKMKQIETMATAMIFKEKVEAIKLMSSVLGRLCDSLKEGLCDGQGVSYDGAMASAQLHHGHIVTNNHMVAANHGGGVCETGPDGTVLISTIEANDARHVPFQVMNTQHETVGNDFFSAECAKYEPIVKISEVPCDTSQLQQHHHHHHQRTSMRDLRSRMSV